MSVCCGFSRKCTQHEMMKTLWAWEYCWNKLTMKTIACTEELWVRNEKYGNKETAERNVFHFIFLSMSTNSVRIWLQAVVRSNDMLRKFIAKSERPKCGRCMAIWKINLAKTSYIRQNGDIPETTRWLWIKTIMDFTILFYTSNVVPSNFYFGCPFFYVFFLFLVSNAS